MQSRLDTTRQIPADASGLANIDQPDSGCSSPDKYLPHAQTEPATALGERQVSTPAQSAQDNRKADIPPPLSLPYCASVMDTEGMQPTLDSPLTSPGSDCSSSVYFSAESDSKSDITALESDSSDSVYFDAEDDDVQHCPPQLAAALTDQISRNSTRERPSQRIASMVDSGVKWTKDRFKRLWSGISKPSTTATPPTDNAAASLPATNPSPPVITPPSSSTESTATSFKDYFLMQGLKLAGDSLIQQALANAISTVIIAELKQASAPALPDETLLDATRRLLFQDIRSFVKSSTDSVINQSLSYGAGRILNQSNTRYINGFVETISSPVCQLVGEFYQRQLDWIDSSQEGRSLVQDALAHFISERVTSAARVLGEAKSADDEPTDTLPSFLSQKVSTGCQHGAALLQQRLSALVNSGVSRQFIDDMVMQLVVDGSDKLQDSFQDLHARAFEIIRTTLHQTGTYLLNLFQGWNTNKKDARCIKKLRDHIIEQIAHETTCQYNKIGDKELLKILPKELFLRKILLWLFKEAVAELSTPDALGTMIDQLMTRVEPQITRALQEQVSKVQWLATHHHRHGQNFSTLANRLALNEAIKNHGNQIPVIQATQDGTSSDGTTNTHFTLPPLQPAEVEAMGQGLVSALQLGLQTLEDQREAIEIAIAPCLEQLIHRGFVSAQEHGGRWLTTEQDSELMEAVLPWCQSVSKGLLHASFIEGLQATREWLEQDTARATMVKALLATPKTGSEPVTDLNSLVIPRIRNAIDERLDQVMAHALREGAQRYRRAMSSHQFLAMPVIRNALNDAISKAIQAVTVKADEQLEPLAQEVLQPVLTILQQELTALGPATIRFMVDWLKEDRHTHDLMEALLPSVEPLIARVLSEIVAAQLDTSQNPATLRQLTAPWLSGLVQQLLTPAVHYSLKRVVDWAEVHQQAFESLIQPQLAQTLDAAQPLILDTIRKRLEQLAQAMTGNDDVALKALQLADQLAPEDSQAPEDSHVLAQPKSAGAITLSATELETISSDLAAGAQLAINELCRHEDVIRSQINASVNDFVARAVSLAANDVALRVAGDDAEAMAAEQFAAAVTPRCQQLTTSLLSEALTEGLRQNIQPLIHSALASAMTGEQTTDSQATIIPTLDSLAMPHIQSAIDTTLNQTMAAVLQRGAHQLQGTMDSQQLLAIPAVRDAVDHTLRTAICDGANKTRQQLEPLILSVLTPVTRDISIKLLEGQMAVARYALDWLSQQDNAQELIATITPGIHSVIERVLTQMLNHTMTRAAPLQAVLQPALLRLVETMLPPTFGHILESVVNWARDRSPIIVEQLQQEIEHALAICQPMLIDAIRQRADQLVSVMSVDGPESTAARALSLAQHLAPTQADYDQQVGNGASPLLPTEVASLSNGVAQSVQLVLHTLHDRQETMLATLNPHLERVVDKAVTCASEHLAQQVAGADAATMRPGQLSHAAVPWCQNMATNILNQVLTEGFRAAMTWANEEAHQAIATALTNTEDSASFALMPHIKQALDDRLDRGMANMLRGAAAGLQTTLDNNELLAQPFVRNLLDQQVRKVISNAAAGTVEQLEPLSQAVLDPVREQLKQELLTLQTTTIDSTLAWLKNPEQTVGLMATVLPPVADIIERLLSDTLAAQLEIQAPMTAPMINGLVQHLLPPAANYTLERLTDWAEKNHQAIADILTPQIEQTLDTIQPLLLTAIEQRLKLLQTVASDEEDVVAGAEALANRLDPNGTLPATSDESALTSYLDALIPDFSRTITELVDRGAQQIRSEQAVTAALTAHVGPVVNAAIAHGTAAINQRLAEASDGDVTHINQGVAQYLQGMVAGYLTQGITCGIEQAASAINKNLYELNKSIEATLRQQLLGEEGAGTTDLTTDLPVLITRIIDQTLDKQALLAGINAWLTDHAATATPRLHQAMDQVLRHIMANISEFLLQHGIAGEVLPEVQNVLIQTLITAQADLINGVTGWLGDPANQSTLVAQLSAQLQPAFANLVARNLAQTLVQHQPCEVVTVAPAVNAIVNKALNHAFAGIVSWVADELPKHQQQIIAMTRPLIHATVDKAMPAVAKAVQDKALVLAQDKAQDINFNRLAVELSAAFAEHIDLENATSGAVKVGPNTNVTKELPRLLCLLAQSAETFHSLGGNLNEPVCIDHLAIGDIEFNNVQAQLVEMPDGSIQIHSMNLTLRGADGIDIDIEMSGISIRPQWPKSSKLYKAAVLANVAMMSPADAAATVFNAFTPDSIEIKIGQISGEFHDTLLDGPHEDTVGFGLSKLELDVRLHKYYPKLYTDIRVCPKESIIASVRGEGLVEHIDADIKIDANRQGHVDIRGQANPGRLNRLLGWLIGGKIHVNARIPVQSGIATLNDISSITAITDRRFSGLCNAILKNTLRANHPELIPGEDGKEVIKLKLALFAENRSNPVTSWLAKTANRVFRFFFPKPIEIRVAFRGIPYTPPAEGEKGLGSFNFSRFVDGLSPCPVSLQSETHRQLLRDLRATDNDRTARLRQLDRVIDHVISEFRLGNTPSDLNLVREIPLADLQLLVENALLNRLARPRLLFLLACLTEALPEKAVQLINACGPESHPNLLDLIIGTPRSEWLTNPDGTVMEPDYQWQQFKRLRRFWHNSRNNPDGSIYGPSPARNPVRQCTQRAVELIDQLGDKLNLPDELKLLLARDFDFASKLITPGANTSISGPQHTAKPAEQQKDWRKTQTLLPPVGGENERSAAA